MAELDRIREILAHDINADFLRDVAIAIVWEYRSLYEANKLSPAMAAGVSDRLWSMEDIVALIDQAEGGPKKRGPYKARQTAPISN